MRRALVTGASSETGQAVIRALLADGWEVIGTSRSQPAPFNMGTGGSFRWHCMDLSDERYTYGLGNMVGNRMIDLIVHCAPASLKPVVVHEIRRFVRGGAIFDGGAYLSLRPKLSEVISATA